MQQVPGVDLKSVLEDAQNKVLDQKKADITAKLVTLLSDSEKADNEVKNAQKNLDGKVASAKKLSDKLASVAEGNWDVLQDNKQQQPQE